MDHTYWQCWKTWPLRSSITESDPLAFTPVPTAYARHDGWTPERQRDFIAQLARCGVVSAAAKAVGMSPKSAYAARKRAGADGFAATWDTAVDQGATRAIDTAIDRALNGTVRPVFYRGKQVGEYRVYDNRLLLAAVRALDPRAPRAELAEELDDPFQEAFSR